MKYEGRAPCVVFGGKFQVKLKAISNLKEVPNTAATQFLGFAIISVSFFTADCFPQLIF